MFRAHKFSMIAGVLSALLSGCSDGGPPKPGSLFPRNGMQREPILVSDGGDSRDGEVDVDADDDDAGEIPGSGAGENTAARSGSEAVLCDGSPGITFAAAALGGGNPVPGTQVMAENGHSFIIVEGTCRFYAQRGRLERAVTGVLSPQQLDALRDSLQLESWRSCHGRVAGALDGPEHHFVYGRSERARGGIDACVNIESPDEPGLLLMGYQRLVTSLIAAGQPVQGDIRYLLVQGDDNVESHWTDPAAWPLGDPAEVAMSPAAASGYEPGSSKLAQGAEAAALRALWQDFLDDDTSGREPGSIAIPVEVNGARYQLFLRDSLPLEDTRGLIEY
jgi:hypothetical protein